MRTLDLIIAILLIMWLGGFSLHFAGNLIHILLIVAVIALIIRLINREV